MCIRSQRRWVNSHVSMAVELFNACPTFFGLCRPPPKEVMERGVHLELKDKSGCGVRFTAFSTISFR